MKKIYTALCAAVLGTAMVSAAGIEVTFNGNDHDNWKFDSSAEVSNGHLHVTMPENNGKYRADFSFGADNNENPLTLSTTDDKILAIKFIGERPQANFTFEVRVKKEDGSLTWMNTKWKNNAGMKSVLTASNNNIYYIDLSADDQFAAQGASAIVPRINVKVADNTTEPHEYTLDWIKTYPSVEALEADKNWKDDGANDADEAAVAESPVMNETSGVGYANLADAWNAAANGDVIVVNENQEIKTRLNCNSRTITVKGGKDGVVIKRGWGYKGLLFLTSLGDLTDSEGKPLTGAVILENLTIDGGGMTDASVTIEASKSGKVTLNNVTINGAYSTNNQGIISAKDGGAIKVNGVKFADSSVPEGRGEIFMGTSKMEIEGDNDMSVFIEKANTVSVVGTLTNTKPINLIFEDTRDLTAAATIVLGCTDIDKFNIMNTGYTVKAEGEDLVIVEGTSSLIGNLTANENATVDVYSIQGVLLRSGVSAEEAVNGLDKGLYIIGGKKVLVK